MGITTIGGMSFLPAQTVKAARPVWTPPATATIGTPNVPASSSAGDALIKGERDAAEQAFLFRLKIAFSDADRAGAARAFLRYTSGLSNAELQSDPALGSLVVLSKSILSNAQNERNPGAFSTVA